MILCPLVFSVSYLTKLSVARISSFRLGDERWIRNDLERSYISLIEIISQNLPLGTEENGEKSESV
jgi:hypothetical protein